jgi:hypothetical protein
VNIDENAWYNQANATLTNNGDFNVAAGKTLAIANADQVFTQAAGTLDVLGDLEMDGDTFNFDGGVLSGNSPLLMSSQLNIGATSTGAGEFRMQRSGGTLSGNIAAAQTVRLQVTSSFNAEVTASAGFTNDGTIILEDPANTVRDAILQVTGGTLINTGVINVVDDGNSASGTDRQINAVLTNDGIVNIYENAWYSQANSTLTNNGDFNIAATKTLSIADTGQVFTQANGTFDLAGDLVLFDDTFNFTGGSIIGGGTATLTSSDVLGVGTAEVNFDLTGATVDLGSSPGILNVVEPAATTTGGNWTQSSSTALNIEIGGDTPGTGVGFHDQLNIENVADLSGTLNVAFIGGHMPDSCQAYEIITFGSRTGSLPTVKVTGLPLGFDARVDFHADRATVIAFNTAEPINIHPTSVSVTEGGRWRLTKSAWPPPRRPPPM